MVLEQRWLLNTVRDTATQKGVRCDACTEAERIYQRDYRLRGGSPKVTETVGNSEHHPAVPDGLPQGRPGLAQAALALGRLIDNPRALSSHPPAARVLAVPLDKLRSTSVQGRRGRLEVVRTLTEKDGAGDRCGIQSAKAPYS